MKRSVLFVDDEPQVLNAFKDALRKENLEIHTATSGKQGLEVLALQRVDVIISDEQMPGMSGSEFLSLARRIYPDTIRIILTGQASLDAAIRAINEGEVYRFLAKPCNLVDLSFTIRQALQTKDLARESAKLLVKSREQQALLTDLEREHPGITEVKRDSGGVLVLDEGDIGIDDLLDEIRTEVGSDESDR